MIKQSLQLLTAAVLINTVNFNTSHCMENNIIIHNDLNINQLCNKFKTILNGINCYYIKNEDDNEPISDETIYNYIDSIIVRSDYIKYIAKNMFNGDIDTFNYNKKLINDEVREIKQYCDYISHVGDFVLYTKYFYESLIKYKQNILNSYDDKLLNIIININKIDSVQKYLQINIKDEQQNNKIKEIISKVEKYAKHINLKNRLYMNAPFCKILENITNKQNMNNQINTFYENLFGKNLNKLKTILVHGTNEELETISEILKKDEVQDYFINWASKDQSNAMKEDFKDGIEGTIIENNESKTKYQKYLFHYLLKVINIDGIDKFINKLKNISNEYTSSSQQNIIKSIINISNKALSKCDKDDFKEILDNHNLRNVYKIKFQEEKAPNTFFNMNKNIENAISNNNNELIDNSVQEFYNSLFGHNFDNFRTVLFQGTPAELQLILETLNKQQVKEYISKNELSKMNKVLLLIECNKCMDLLNIIIHIRKNISRDRLNIDFINEMNNNKNETRKLNQEIETKEKILDIVNEYFETRHKTIIELLRKKF